MSVNSCSKCGKNLKASKSDSTQICDACGYDSKFNSSETSSSAIIGVESEMLPVGVDVIESRCIVNFSNGTQQEFLYDSHTLQFNLIVWLWRIKNKIAKNDYVTFGIDFSQLREGTLIPRHELMKTFFSKDIYYGYLNKNLPIVIVDQQPKTMDEMTHLIKTEKLLVKFLKSEIQRYFKEKGNSSVKVIDAVGGGLKIPSKIETYSAIIGLTMLILAFVGGLASTKNSYSVSQSTPQDTTSQDNSKNPEYIRSVIERSGVGETIDSPQEIVKACIVLYQDKGMTYSQAYERCH